MLERDFPCQNFKIKPLQQSKNLSHQGFDDLILSLSHRLGAVESSLSSKIDRSECMLILETKANFSQLLKISDDVAARINNLQHMLEQKSNEKTLEKAEAVIKYKDKILGKKKQNKKPKVEKKNFLLMKPQQLYLQSSQTMFSLVVDEINTLKQAQKKLFNKLQERQKITLSINNEVCEKIETLEKQIIQKYDEMSQNLRATQQKNKFSFDSSSLSETKIDCQEIIAKNVQLTRSKNQSNLQSNLVSLLQPEQLGHLSRSIEQLQRELAKKLNIADVVPIIKSNMEPLGETVVSIRTYTEGVIANTKNILENQSEINQELSSVCRLGWWVSYEGEAGYARWSKEIVNFMPENYGWAKDSQEIVIAAMGLYIVRVLVREGQAADTIEVQGTQVRLSNSELLLRVEQSSVLRIPSRGSQMLLSIQKV